MAVERGFMSRSEALKRVLAAVRFFAASPQGAEPDSTGRRGFYYHFLHMEKGTRASACELSTMDTGLLILGMLVAREYFSGATGQERELRERVGWIYRRTEWNWACNRALTLSHGHVPEKGFLKNRWLGYSEGLLLYVLALGSPTHPLSRASYRAWTRTYQWKRVYGYEYLYAGPLFIHQFMHAWIDFRGLQDDFMKEKSTDYFENSLRATYIQREYCRRNPLGFQCHSELSWGITACDGPGPCMRRIKGRKVRFLGYHARGVPFGPDDGTISAGAAVASLPFAPEIVLPTIEYFLKTEVGKRDPCGFAASFNPMFGDSTPQNIWQSKYNFGLNHGLLILMIENFRSGLIWRLMRNCQPIVKGLQRAGFSGAWLPSGKVSH
ncbi:MAG: hypothetical protein LV481_09460 [Methylacidiphilales bacterium]|nr:hypothetical protein [Candidatus Methylacidiphilales bacterium]